MVKQLGALTEVGVEAAVNECLGFFEGAAVQQVQHHAVASSKLGLQPLRTLLDDVPGHLSLLIPILQYDTVPCSITNPQSGFVYRS